MKEQIIKKALEIAGRKDQIVGRTNNLYITLEQLDEIVQEITEETTTTTPTIVTTTKHNVKLVNGKKSNV